MRRSKRVRAAQNKGGRRGSNSNDFISELPVDLLLYILSLLPLKDAVITGTLSKKWRFVWCHLIQLNFVASQALDRIAWDQSLHISERPKYINQVDSVIQQHRGPAIRDFRIRFDLDQSNKIAIDNWLQFAVCKKVEMLELNLMLSGQILRYTGHSYDFPIGLMDTRGFRYKWPSLGAHIVKIPSLRKLFLKSVNVGEATLEQLIRNSPLLETLSIHGSGYLRHIRIGGESLALKHFEIVSCRGVTSIYLYNFNLVSFTYKGEAIDLDLVNLPKFKELDIGEGNSGLENNLFSQVASCVSRLEVLSFTICRPKGSFMLTSVPEIPEFPNVKKLSLKIGAWNDNSLLEFTSLAEACPSLETFAIELLWLSPKKRRRKVRHVANHPHPHLKVLEIVGYYGRISDLELAVYVIENAVALKKVLIDPHCDPLTGVCCVNDFPKIEEAARSHAKKHFKSLVTRGVELVIL